MEFVIEPFTGAGPIKLGMSRNEIQALGLGHVRSFKKTPASALPCDQFFETGVFVYYKQPGVAEAIEFATPSGPSLFGKGLFAHDFNHIKRFVLERDPNVELNTDGFLSHSLGIAIYAPASDEMPRKIESVLVFCRGYFES